MLEVQKFAILTHLEVLNFNFVNLCTLLNQQNSEPQKCHKTTILEILETPKLISRKSE